MIVLLAALGIIVAVVGTYIGFSITFYMDFRLLIDKNFRKACEAYDILLAKKSVSNPSTLRELLKLVHSSLLKLGMENFPEYGRLRHWEETVRLAFKPGEIDKRQNFVGINPIYGYNKKGEVTFVADKNTFHQQFMSIVTSGQQRTAFFILLLAYIIQFIAVFQTL